MKKLFFLLVVVNLVIWLWGQRAQLARVTDPVEPGLGVIRLLDEAELAARREQALARAAVPEPPVADGPAEEGTPPGSAIVQGAAVDAEPALATTDSPAEPVAAEARPEAAPVPAPAEPVAAALAGSPVEAATEPPMPGEEAVVPTPAQVSPASTAAAAIVEPSVSVAEVSLPGPPETPVAAAVPEPAEAAGGAAPPTTAAAPDPARDETPAPILEQTPALVAAEPPPAPADAAATSEPPPPEPAAPEPADRAAVTAPDQPDAVAAQPAAPAVEPREVLYVCESIGPFAERPAAARVQAGMIAPFRRVTLREERSSRPVRHWVLAPVQPSKDATAEYLTSLGRAGVKDAWRIPSGPFAGRLAVGVFQSAENARKHADMLAAKGVAAEVHAPGALEPIRLYWVDYERPADAAAPDLGGGPARPARQIVPRACGRIAGP